MCAFIQYGNSQMEFNGPQFCFPSSWIVETVLIGMQWLIRLRASERWPHASCNVMTQIKFKEGIRYPRCRLICFCFLKIRETHSAVVLLGLHVFRHLPSWSLFCPWNTHATTWLSLSLLFPFQISKKDSR